MSNAANFWRFLGLSHTFRQRIVETYNNKEGSIHQVAKRYKFAPSFSPKTTQTILTGQDNSYLAAWLMIRSRTAG